MMSIVYKHIRYHGNNQEVAYSELAYLGEQYDEVIPHYSEPQTKPLSDEEIWEWFEKNTVLAKESALMIARSIEERHGIK